MCSEGTSGDGRTLPKKGDALSARMPIQCCSLRRGSAATMRWGDAKKAPPLTRSRGMFAASLLVVAVMATYASLAVISLTGGGSLGFPSLPGSVFKGLVNSAVVGWQAPEVKHLRQREAAQGRARPPRSPIPRSSTSARSPSAGTPRQLSLTNTSSAALPLQLSVSNAPGISARFATTGTTHDGGSPSPCRDDQPDQQPAERRPHQRHADGLDRQLERRRVLHPAGRCAGAPRLPLADRDAGCPGRGRPGMGGRRRRRASPAYVVQRSAGATR